MTFSALLIEEFDVWRPGYGAASVEVLIENTTTRARVYSDPALTTEVSQPITLLQKTDSGISFGKFAQSLYVATGYSLLINSTDRTGVKRPPLTSLIDEDASFASSKTARGTQLRRLIDRFDDVIRAEDQGLINETAVTNTQTLAAAIGKAAGQGGGDVLLPAGNIPINTLTLSQRVRLVGQGRSATTLRSTEAQAVITLGGDGAGLKDMTLDGTNLVANSIGVYGVGADELVFDNVEVKRFDVGVRLLGSRRGNWRDLSVVNCAKGLDLLGDLNASGGSNGDEFSENAWRGGRVKQCTTHGLNLSFEDTTVRDNLIEKVEFGSNTGSAVIINGARATRFEGCYWSGNVTNLSIDDDSDSSQSASNTVIGLEIVGGSIDDGAITVDGTAQDITFERVEFSGVNWTLNLPERQILLLDAIEDASVTVGGDTSKLIRRRSTLDGEVAGVTTDATATVAWAYKLAAGEFVYAVAKVIARQRDGVGEALYHIAVGAKRPGDQLDYDGQSANFTVGSILTGGTSSATARIVADSDSGSTGTLTLRDINGEFLDNETITDGSGGSATASGTLTAQNAALDSGGVTALRAAVESSAGLNATFGVNNQELRILVTGLANDTFEWTVNVELTVP